MKKIFSWMYFTTRYCGYGAILGCAMILMLTWAYPGDPSLFDRISRASLWAGLGAFVPLFVNIMCDCISSILLRNETCCNALMLRLILANSFGVPTIFLLADDQQSYRSLLATAGFWSSISVAHVVAICCLKGTGNQKKDIKKVSLSLISSIQCWLLILSSILAQIFLSISTTDGDRALYVFISNAFQVLTCLQSITFLVYHIFTCEWSEPDQHTFPVPSNVTLLWHLALLAIRSLADNILTFAFSCENSHHDCEYVSKYYLQLAYVVAVLILPEKINVYLSIQGLHRAMEQKNATTRYVAHELRTPLNIVHLSMMYVRAEVAKLSSRLGSIMLAPILMAVDDVYESCETATGILDEFLTVDKMQAGKLVANLEEIEPISFIQNALRQFLIIAQQNKIVFQLVNDIDGTAPLRILADTHKLGQVMRNLLSNAFKFTPQDGVVIVKIGIVYGDKVPIQTGSVNGNERSSVIVPINDSREDGDCPAYLDVRVIDTGTGISLADQRKLFQQYVQLKANSVQRSHGSGLGLWISKAIVEMHYGTLTAESAGEGHGCTFILQLPLHEKNQHQDQVQVQDRGYAREYDIERDAGSSHAASLGGRQPSNSLADESLKYSPSLQSVSTPEEAARNRKASKGDDSLRSHGSGPNSGRISSKGSARSGSKSNGMDSRRSHGSSSRSGAVSSLSNDSALTNGQGGSNNPFEPLPLQNAINCTPAGSRPHSSNREPHFAGTVEHHPHSPAGTTVINTAASQPASMRVNFLVVDDSALCRRAVRRSLEAAGHTVAEASGGLEALSLLAAKEGSKIDVILLENDMSEMDGTEATKKIRKQGFTGIIFALSGDANDTEVRAFMASGADEKLSKPLNMAQLTAALSKYFHKRAAPTVEPEITMRNTSHHVNVSHHSTSESFKKNSYRAAVAFGPETVSERSETMPKSPTHPPLMPENSICDRSDSCSDAAAVDAAMPGGLTVVKEEGAIEM